MSPLKVGVILGLIASAPVSLRSHAQGSHAGRQRPDLVVPSPPAHEPPVSVPEHQGADNKTQNRFEWFWPPIWSNWALVFAAIWAGILALRTLRSLRQQTTANRIEARAARDSAQALLLEQRAWLSVESLAAEWKPVETDGTRPGVIHLKLTNCGHLPATDIHLSFCTGEIGFATFEGGQIPDDEMQRSTSPGDMAPSATRVIPFGFKLARRHPSVAQFIRGRLDYQHGHGSGWTTFYGVAIPGWRELRMPGEHNQTR